MSRLQKVDPNAFNEFKSLINSFKAEYTTANDLAPFAPKTAGEGVTNVGMLESIYKNKKNVKDKFSEYALEAERQYKDGKKIDRKLLVKVSNSLEEEKTQDLELSC